METFIVLTDFSQTAKCALLYACTLVKQLKGKTIVLYHSYDIAVPVSEVGVVVADEKSLHESALERLKNIKEEIRENIPPGLVFQYRADEVGLNNINSVAQEEGADLIIMGTSNKTKLEEIFLGSNAVTVCTCKRLSCCARTGWDKDTTR
jgi:nucleotide-binding universal stress UspA family protein